MVLSNCCKASGEPTCDFGDGGKFAMIEADRARTSVKAQVAKEPPNQQSKFAQAPHVNKPFFILILQHGLCYSENLWRHIDHQVFL